ncbi:uncharacterized protein LOC134848598 [Symsagittifera roscoffensis]|uniref:uncharacterized protein LOC134848598 n=1 Tax=Symsagittifera roscoffensis TaxID=84072 RepID=UPI00307C66F8
MSKSSPANCMFKVIVVGDSGVGKTNLLLRYTKDEFKENPACTLGAELSRVEKNIDDDHVIVDLWDTAGQEKFKSLTKIYCRGAHGVILVYDISNHHSFEQLESWFQTPSDKGVEKSRKHLQDNGLLALPFDKGVGFCVIKKETHEKKLKHLLQAEQFSERKNLTDSVIMEIEKDINKELLAMKKKDEISEALYTRLR